MRSPSAALTGAQFAGFVSGGAGNAAQQQDGGAAGLTPAHTLPSLLCPHAHVTWARDGGAVELIPAHTLPLRPGGQLLCVGAGMVK